MTEHHTPDTHGSSDGLWRWLLGGLAGGGIILGLLIAAYAIGYHRGQHHPHATASAAPTVSTPATTTAPVTTAPAPASGPVQATPALVARGKSLFAADGCSGCHALTGAAGAGPGLKGLAGSKVTLVTGQTVTADDAYLQESITTPDARVVKGYSAGLMPAATAAYDLGGKPADVQALVAFIASQK